MTNLLSLVASYLASKLTMTAGTNVFYNEMPDEPAKCVLVQEIQNPGIAVHPQIDGEIHRIKVSVRDTTYELANNLAQLCWRWLLTDKTAFTSDKRTDTTGFVTIADLATVQITLYGNPVWEKSDQQGRKYYSFYATILTKR